MSSHIIRKVGEPLTWKLVEETVGDIENHNGINNNNNNNPLLIEVPVLRQQQHSHHNHNHHHHHHQQGSRISDTSSQTESRGGAGESFTGIETKVYINTSGESGLGCW